MCRVCGTVEETVEHLGECVGLKEVYTSLRVIDEKGGWKQRKLNLFGLDETGGGREEPLQNGVSAVHMIVWRELIGEITRVDTVEGWKFSAQGALKRAKERCLKRMRAFEQEVEIACTARPVLATTRAALWL